MLIHDELLEHRHRDSCGPCTRPHTSIPVYNYVGAPTQREDMLHRQILNCHGNMMSTGEKNVSHFGRLAG
jgi:hypothetical protein